MRLPMVIPNPACYLQVGIWHWAISHFDLVVSASSRVVEKP